MFWNKRKKNSNNEQKNDHQKELYAAKVETYKKWKGFKIIEEIYELIDSGLIDMDGVKELLGHNYPLAPWIDEKDEQAQMICLLGQMGYVFERKQDGSLCLKNEEEYKQIVRNYLKLSGSEILEALAMNCTRTHGRISYEEMRHILGFHFPKAPYADKTDLRVCVILFLKAAGLTFNFDENHVYFP